LPTPNQNLTHTILRTIGSPFARSGGRQCPTPNIDSYRYARANRVALLYLEAVGNGENFNIFSEENERLRARYSKTMEIVQEVSHILNRSDVHHAFFKTLRPYQEITVDLDILIFGASYPKAIKALKGAGYILLNGDRASATFHEIKANLNIDLYNEVNASRFVYLEKERLERFTVERRISKDETVTCLDEAADLLCVIAHSVIKEQMYVISEYYTTIYYLSEFDNARLGQFLGLVKDCHLCSAVCTHLTLTGLLHHFVHRVFPKAVADIIEDFGMDHREFLRVEKRNYRMPHRLHVMTFARAVFEKLKEGTARRSLGNQALSMFNPAFTSRMFYRLLDHITRKTY